MRMRLTKVRRVFTISRLFAIPVTHTHTNALCLSLSLSLSLSACFALSPHTDLDVCHLQLLLFAWHSFSVGTRRALLLRCANAIIHVAKERK